MIMVMMNQIIFILEKIANQDYEEQIIKTNKEEINLEIEEDKN